LRVCVRLHPTRRDRTVEEERQRQRQHRGLARAVVAAQQQATVVEPDLLVVVVEDGDQAEPHGLPPFGGGAGQLVHRLGPAGVAGELVEAGHRAVRAVMVGAATAKRRSAGSEWTTTVSPSPVTRTRPRPTRRSTASATSAFSAPRSWAARRQ